MRTVLIMAGALLVAAAANEACAQQPKPAPNMSLRPSSAAELRAREVESASALAALGDTLYRADVDKRDGFAYCRNAHQLAERGEFRLAIREASKALFLGRAQRNPHLVALARRDLAAAYVMAGENEAAIEHAKASLAELRSVDRVRTSDVKATALKVLGDAALRQGRPADALKHYAEARDADSSRVGNQARLAEASAHLALGDVKRAREAVDKVSPGDNARYKVLIERAHGNIALAEKDYARAAQLFQNSAQSLAQPGGLPSQIYDRLWAEAGLAEARLLSGDRQAALAAYRAALDTADRLRGLFSSFVFKAGFLNQSQAVFDQAVDLMIDAGLAEEAFETSERGRARAMLDQMNGRIEASVAGAAFSQPIKAVAKAAAIRAALPPRTALIEYHVLPERTIAFVVRADGVTATALPERRADLDRQVRAFRDAVTGRRADAAGLAADLYRRLVAPLGELGGGETLVFVPHKTLHYLPFHALRGPAGYLIESNAVAYAPSASGYVALAQRQHARVQRALALANPAADGGAPPLPAAEREVSALKANLAGAEIDLLLREQATRDAFIQRAPGSQVVHVAAHAAIDEVDPIHSRILLARGELEAHEVYRLDLSAARLVVLSACESGLGRVSGGDEFVGFKQSFLGAGAGGLLVSLWPVDDESTAAMIEEFYRQLTKMGSAGALRQAQLALLRQPAYAEPLFWAPFTWVGAAP